MKFQMPNLYVKSIYRSLNNAYTHTYCQKKKKKEKEEGTPVEWNIATIQIVLMSFLFHFCFRQIENK